MAKNKNKFPRINLSEQIARRKMVVGIERKNVERRVERGIKLNLTEKALAEYISRFTNNKQSKKG